MNWLSALDSPVYHSRNRVSANAVPRTRAGVLQAGAGAWAGPDETCAALEVRDVESRSLLRDMEADPVRPVAENAYGGTQDGERSQ
ncbi:MAG: hypothetical protein LQ339_006408 [Xanthoria mediterranea]|nr:MAG: hypothetical protein LQ339_006408 [Xanthoria mediterranea]